jgi:thiamine pyrophosphokinase
MSGTTVSSEPIILIVVDGDPATAPRLPSVPVGSMVIAVDGGLRPALAAGLPVHHLVGDLDSATPEEVAMAARLGATIHRHPADKDATDLELALDLAVGLAERSQIGLLLVVGAGGGRLDLLLGDVLLLAADRTAHLRVGARLGEADVHVVRPGRPVEVDVPLGAQVSLLPVHGPADGVTTEGLRWSLLDAHLAPGTSRAVSNEAVAAPVSVAVRSGVLAVIAPGRLAPAVAARTHPYDPSPRPAPPSSDPIHPEEEQP